MNNLANINLLIGRIIIGLYFLVPGAIAKIFNYSFIYDYMAEHEVPYIHIALVLTIIIQLFCAISIIIGWHSKLSAFILALLTLLISYYMHDFWNMAASIQQEHETQNFVKNLGIFAGLLILSAANPGKYSFKSY
ncbi:MAG: DoxX family protein [Candidatus Pelagibacterales bacterium]|jgi:putative oxidoreductase|tara:strand:- start:3356 stop:3760 length:405 start_codon:yes stop_codon:yes gene_type:complete